MDLDLSEKEIKLIKELLEVGSFPYRLTRTVVSLDEKIEAWQASRSTTKLP
ncbi:hypothetical protein LCGC14_2042060 [marine sediment metagenome]|uniref:Uncharacterized protein n=1 Tax=marine sediment metagenome TaxID=412755 RepID=A0A0F9HNJ7_9ZZZZ